MGPPEPIIDRFTASSESIDEGSTVFLAWEVANADSVTIRANPGEVLVDASLRLASVQETAPLVTDTRFELEAVGPAGTARASVTVSVEPGLGDAPPRIITFRVTPPVYPGFSTETRIFWSASGDLALTANGEAVPQFDGAATGSLNLQVSQARVEFELSATRAGETVTATQTVERSREEVEPNDTPEQANVPSDGVGLGRIDREDDRDFYRIDVPEQGRVRAEVDDGGGECPFDSRLFLWRYLPEAAPSIEFVAQNDDISSENVCSLIDPTQDLAASSLPEGPYLLEVRAAPGAVGRPYRLRIDVEGPACGNGTPELGAGEGCDDGNLTDGDGCSSACQVETVAMLASPDTREVSIPALPAGARALVAVELDGPGTIFAGLPGAECPDDTVQLLDASALEGTRFRRLSDSQACQVAPRPVGAGSYYVQVTAPPGGLPAQPLFVSARPSGCGDWILDAGEACDLGDTTSGDGCSDLCTLEIDQTLTGGTRTVPMILPAAGGQSVVRLDLSVPTSLRVNPVGSSCPDGGRIVLQNASFQVLGRVESATECPTLDARSVPFAAGLAAETHYLSFVGRPPGDAAALDYLIDLVPASCGNQIREPLLGEQCDGEVEVECSVNCEVAVEAAIDLAGCMGGICVPPREGTLEPGLGADRYLLESDRVSGRLGAQLFIDPILNNTLRMRLLTADGDLIADVGGTPEAPASLLNVPFLAPQVPNTPDPEPIYLEIYYPNQIVPADYAVEVLVGNGFCGNGILEFGEACDDANLNDDDGCSQTCRFEIPVRSEQEGAGEQPNDDLSTAEVLALVPNVTQAPLVGALLPAGDVDFYNFTVPGTDPVSLRIFLTADPQGAIRCNEASRGRVTLFSTGGDVLASNDGACGDLDGIDGQTLRARDLPPGGYFVRIDRPGGGQSLAYALFIQALQ